ncbi:MAG TPA: LysR family transcriptional regulator [Intrasporangium sp.]|nr:LysR family transcriptional regulator [Intrasporangium sp.]
MELRHLRYFVAVAEERHFGRAAQRLHMAQPPLSQQIKALEAELGVRLLERSTRRVDLTAAGERYLERARAVLEAVDAAGGEARRVQEGEVGHLRIGFTGSATYELLPRLARRLRQQLPGLTLDLTGEMLTPRQVRALKTHTIDLGFLRPPVRVPDLEVHVLRNEPLVAVLPETHPFAERQSVVLADLRDEVFISYPSHQASVTYDAVLSACGRVGFSPKEIHEVAETSTLVSFVAAGLGVALVPASVQHLQITGAVYRPISDVTHEVGLAVAHRAGDRTPHMDRVLEEVHSLLGSG